MFGHKNDDGILRKSVEFLLNKGISFHAELIEIHATGLSDCGGIKKLPLKAGTHATKLPVENIDQFDEHLQRALKHRIQKATNQNANSSRSHAVFKIVAEKKSFLFADLAGFESQENKPNADESKFINKSLLDLNTVLSAIAAKRAPVCSSSLTKYFKQYFIRGDIFMFFHVHAASSDKFTTELAKIKDLAVSIKDTPKNASRILWTANN